MLEQLLTGTILENKRRFVFCTKMRSLPHLLYLKNITKSLINDVFYYNYSFKILRKGFYSSPSILSL